jgi:hypothetical protein
MPTGLAMPVGVNQGGGARLSSGDENDDKIIRLAMGDDGNENAFQQNVGVGADMIFGQGDQVLQASIMRRINDVFKRFEAAKRFVLRRNTIKWSQNSATQEMSVEFKYLSIESDREQTFRDSFSATTTVTNQG